MKKLVRGIIDLCFDDLLDCLQQPCNNKPLPQILAPSASNQYTGMDVSVDKIIDGCHPIIKKAYTTGSGTYSTCLDLKRFQVKGMKSAKYHRNLHRSLQLEMSE
jgi:hypothetical protein